MPALRRATAIKREQAAAMHIPYTAQIAGHLIKTAAGDYVQVFKIGGASFESADDEQLNTWHERLNVLWRNIASANVALWTHIVRRRERPVMNEAGAPEFAGALASKYRARLAAETLMVNELYVAVVYRPATGVATGLITRALSKADREGSRLELVDAIDVCEKLGQTVYASLARYEPELLTLYTHYGRQHSRLLEYLGLLINGEWQPVPLPRAPLNEVLATTRLFFGTEAIEYRMPTGSRTGAMLGIKEYPTPSVVGMYDRLLSAPFPFVLTQSFAFLSKGTSQGLLQRQGAVRTIPAAPVLDRLEGKVSTNYSVTSGTGGDNHMVQAVVNVPLVRDKLSIRGAVYQFEESGYYHNRAGSNAAFQQDAASFAALAFAQDEEEAASASYTGGRIAALFQPTEALKFTLSYLTQKTELDGLALAHTGRYGGFTGTYDQLALQVAPKHVVRGQKGGVSDTDIDLASATMQYAFGWADLLATFSHIDSGSTYSNPWSSGTLVWPLSNLGTGPHEGQSGEIRLTTRLGGAWNFLGGVYAETFDDQANFEYLWYGSDNSNPFGARFVGNYFDIRNLKQRAAFAEASWELLPGLTLMGGARAYKYDRTVRIETLGPLFNSPATANTVVTTTSDGDASGTSFRGNLSYKPSDNALVYASWSQGFRFGKPQPGLPPGLCDVDGDGIVDGSNNVTIEDTKITKSDSLDNTELGAKFTLLDRRVVIAADVYRIDWSDVPFNTAAACGLGYHSNAGGAVSKGMEFEANFYLNPSIRIDIGGSTVNASLTKDAPAAGGFKGDRLLGSPKVSANLGVQYAFDLAGYQASVRADSIYVGKFFNDFRESPRTESGDYVKVDVSARMAIRKIDVDVFLRNLTNEHAFTYRNWDFIGYRIRPRTIGIQFGYTFE